MKLNDLSPDITRCSDSCEPDEWYIAKENADHTFTEYCADSCNNPSTTYSAYNLHYNNNGVKSCLSNNCPSGTYKDSTNNACVSRDECNFYESNNCHNSCPSSKKFHNYGKKECIAGCTEEEYLYEDNFICYKKEDCNFIDETTTPNKKCLATCIGTTHEYHDFNSKSCINSCSINKRYHTDGGYICYSSCSEIPGDYKYEEIDGTTVLKCYDQKPNSGCDVYYKKADGIFKCTTKSVCISNLNYNYILGYECKDNCNGYYQMDTTEASLNYIKCFANLNSALADSSVKFCDTNQKKCWNSFPSDDTYYVKSQLSTGPNKYELVKECPNFYYKKTSTDSSVNNKNWCVDDCKTIESNSIHKYFYRGNKQCLNSCTAISKYYDDDNNECLDSCETRPDKPFANYNTNSNLEKCLPSCGSTKPYHNFNSHLCLTNCNEDNSQNLYHRDPSISSTVNQYICYPSCINIHNGEFRFQKTDNSCSNFKPNTGCDYYYVKSDGVFKCASATDCKNVNYFYILDSECKNICDIIHKKLDNFLNTIEENG